MYYSFLKVEQGLSGKHLLRAMYVTGVRFLVCSCRMLAPPPLFFFFLNLREVIAESWLCVLVHIHFVLGRGWYVLG